MPPPVYWIALAGALLLIAGLYVTVRAWDRLDDEARDETLSNLEAP